MSTIFEESSRNWIAKASSKTKLNDVVSWDQVLCYPLKIQNFVISMNWVKIEMLNQKSIETCSILTKNSIPLIKIQLMYVSSVN